MGKILSWRTRRAFWLDKSRSSASWNAFWPTIASPSRLRALAVVQSSGWTCFLNDQTLAEVRHGVGTHLLVDHASSEHG
jgi:hypothetical protein